MMMPLSNDTEATMHGQEVMRDQARASDAEHQGDRKGGVLETGHRDAFSVRVEEVPPFITSRTPAIRGIGSSP